MRRLLSGVLVGLLGVAAIALVVLMAQVWDAVRKVNEPAPEAFPPQNLQRMARAAGIEAEVDRIAYVNRDVNAGIFVGRDVRLDPKMISDSRYLPGSGRWGTVQIRPLSHGRVYVSFCAATSAGEWSQARIWFPEQEAKAVKALPLLLHEHRQTSSRL